MAKDETTQRFCVTYRDGGEFGAEKPKAKVFHNWFDAIDQADAVTKFWASPTWKLARKIEIEAVEAV